MPKYQKRKPYEYYPKRREVRGQIYLEDGRHRVKLCSWGEARIIGLNKKKEPIYKNRQDATWSERHLAGLYQEKLKELLNKEAVAIANTKNRESIQNLFQDWIDACRHTLSGKTINYYLLSANQYIEGVGNHPITDISGRQVDRFVAHLSDQGLSTASINIRLQNLNSFLGWCEERRLLDHRPKVRQLRREKTLPRILSGDELKRLFTRISTLQQTAREEDRWFYHLHERVLTVGCASGARRAEIFWLPWKSIDLKTGIITVRKQARFMVKEKRDKILPMPLHLLKYLEGIRELYPRETWLLDNGAGQLAYHNPSALTTAFRRHFKALGFDHLGVKPLHGLRAAFADYLHNTVKLPIVDIQMWLGHSDISVTMGYIADPGHRVKEAAKLVGPLTPAPEMLPLIGTTLVHPTPRVRKARKQAL